MIDCIHDAYKLLFENMGAGSCIDEILYQEGRATDYRILDVNPSYEAIMGIPRKKAVGALGSNIYGLEKAPFLDLLARVCETGVKESFESFFEPAGKYLRLTVFRHSPGKIATLIEDISLEASAKAALKENEERVRSILRAAPIGTGIVKSRIFTEVNDTLCMMTGYKRNELLGKSARMLYPTEEDYDYVGKVKYAQISEREIGTVETRWMSKDGVVREILLSSTPLDTGDLSKGVTFTALDITERKRYRRLLETRVRLMAYSMSHNMNELLTATLDEIERLTDSEISFYRFFDPDKKTVLLQAWSSATLSNHCKATGIRRHYPLEEAGVWADCAYEGKPIIHNDYASLPHRKGLPPPVTCRS